MIAPVLAAVLSGFLAEQATPPIDFRAAEIKLATEQSGTLFIENKSDQSVFEVEVVFTYPDARLELARPIETSNAGWRCSEFATSTSCFLTELPAGRLDVVRFAFHIKPNSPNRQPAVLATLSAKGFGQISTLHFAIHEFWPYVVTTTADFGAGSLREQIEKVNANPVCGTEQPCAISFFLIGRPPWTIAPSTPLPPIRKCNVILAGDDDEWLPFFHKEIAISGENSAYGNGLEVRASCAAGVPGVKIASLAVHSWPWNGIYFEAPAAHGDSNFLGHELHRVYVGTDPDGQIARPNRSRGVVTDSPHEVLQVNRSVISGNGRSGVAFFRGKSGVVFASSLGVDRLGKPLGNGAGGIFSFGVPFEASGNTIAYNNFSGIALTPGTPKAAISDNSIHTNGNLPIDWAIDNRSRDDDDETDGILNAPRVLDAFYDASADLTRVRGIVRLKGGAFGGKFTVQLYVAATPRGDVVRELGSQSRQPIPAPPAGTTSNTTFDLVIPGDFRGKLIALQTISVETREGFSFDLPLVSSEISEALPVR